MDDVKIETCILYEEPKAARNAWKALCRSDLASPVRVSLHQGDIRQDQYTVAQSHSRSGAYLGGLAVGLATALLLSAAASLHLLGSLGVMAAFGAGLLGGGMLGAILGMLAGATEPTRLLARAQDAVRHGKVALVARFENMQDARDARQFLAAKPGAITSVR